MSRRDYRNSGALGRPARLAVLAAVHLHGLAGDAMLDSIGEHCMVATDLLRGLPAAFRRAQLTSRARYVSWNG